MSAAPHRSGTVLEPALAPVPAQAPPPEKKSRRWLYVLGLVLIAGVVVWLVLGRRTSPTPQPAPVAQVTVRTATATSGKIEHVVRVAGQTSAIHFANITAPMLRGPDSNREMILLKVAPSGSWVKKGDTIAEIDAQSMVDHVEDLSDTIETAEADIRKRRAEQTIEFENLLQSVRQSKADLDKAQLDYNASETLTDIQRQLLKLTLDESQAMYKQLQADIADKKAAQAAEIKILEYTLLRHTRHRDRHARDVTAFTLRASMDGLVVMQQIWRGGEMGQVQQGDRLFPGQPFMKIVNTRNMQVEANLNQAESSDFRVGQPARIRLDAFKDLAFDGKVHSLGALAAGGWRNSYYVRTVPIRIAIQGNDPRLIPDLSASADVVLQSADNQTIIPLAALKNVAGKSVIDVKSGEEFERREVKAGISNDTHVAIASGLQAGEVVRLD
jgi:multidrug resistance efflux pump